MAAMSVVTAPALSRPVRQIHNVLPRVRLATRVAAASKVSFLRLNLGPTLFAGALAALAGPGGDLWPLWLMALAALALAAIDARSFQAAALAGAVWGVARYGAAFLGARTWGAQVPLVCTLLTTAAHAVPAALLVRAID